jgi:hypothetical protein
VRRLIDRLSDLRVAGFYTRELREVGTRVGFEVVGPSTERRALLAHVRSRSRRRVGRFGVEAAAFFRGIPLQPPLRVGKFNTQSYSRGRRGAFIWEWPVDCIPENAAYPWILGR